MSWQFRIGHCLSFAARGVLDPGGGGGEGAAARSRCPSCGKRLGIWDLVPVFSWIFLKGKCRYCHAPIAAIYPLVELAGGLLVVLAFLFFGISVRFFLALIALPFFLAVGVIILKGGGVPVKMALCLLLAFLFLCWP